MITKSFAKVRYFEIYSKSERTKAKKMQKQKQIESIRFKRMKESKLD